jgi:hypothetical protein
MPQWLYVKWHVALIKPPLIGDNALFSLADKKVKQIQKKRKKNITERGNRKEIRKLEKKEKQRK